MPDAFSFDLRVIDVNGRFIVDPNIFVRVTNEVRTVTMQVAFDAAMVPLRFDDRPAGMVLQLRVTPSRYHDARIFCQVDGKGSITPPEIRVPRRSSEWLPEFGTWQSLGGAFDMLKEKLEVSRAFRLGRASEAEHLVEDAYDAVSPDDESRSLAKMSLLNLYSRLGIETAPGSATPWFSFGRQPVLRHARTLPGRDRGRVLEQGQDADSRAARRLSRHQCCARAHQKLRGHSRGERCVRCLQREDARCKGESPAHSCARHEGWTPRVPPGLRHGRERPPDSARLRCDQALIQRRDASNRHLGISARDVSECCAGLRARAEASGA